MRIEFAHIRERSTTGQEVNFAVFDAKPNNNTAQDRDRLLSELIAAANQAGYLVEAGAIAYEQFGRIQYWGDNFTLSYLKQAGLPQMTHWLEF